MVSSAEVWPDRAIHPGVYLKEELEARGMSQSELATRMERPVQVINEIIRARKSISEETALGLERVLGTPARVWLNLESIYQLTRTRLDEREALEAQAEWLERFPVKQMIHREWIEPGETVADQVRALLRFFGIQSFAQWDERQEALGFRLSANAKVDRFALHAWVRRGEIKGHETPTAAYSDVGFLDALTEIRGLTAADNFWPRMKELCASAGVAAVAVPEFPKTGANGVARWLTSEKALIQLNLRYRWADIFWFTFFHEARHVLMHRQKRVFVDVQRGMVRDEQEHDADSFAADFLIRPALWAEFVATDPRSHAQVAAFAEEARIAPGIVVGRLHHERVIPRSHLNGLRRQLQYTSEDD